MLLGLLVIFMILHLLLLYRELYSDQRYLDGTISPLLSPQQSRPSSLSHPEEGSCCVSHHLRSPGDALLQEIQETSSCSGEGWSQPLQGSGPTGMVGLGWKRSI